MSALDGLPLFIAPPPKLPTLQASDRKRLGRQLSAIRRAMLDGAEWSIAGLTDRLLEEGVHATPTSVSARIRELPDIGLPYSKRQPSPGFWLYRLTGEVVEPRPKVERHVCKECHGTGVGP